MSLADRGCRRHRTGAGTGAEFSRRRTPAHRNGQRTPRPRPGHHRSGRNGLFGLDRGGMRSLGRGEEADTGRGSLPRGCAGIPPEKKLGPHGPGKARELWPGPQGPQRLVGTGGGTPRLPAGQGLETVAERRGGLGLPGGWFGGLRPVPDCRPVVFTETPAKNSRAGLPKTGRWSTN